MKEAFFYRTNEKSLVCLLCPRGCTFAEEGDISDCLSYIRKDNVLVSRNYGVISSASVDPVEKKPLYHFYPGRNILSVGTFGCNMHCVFCQNYAISQNFKKTPPVQPSDITEKALSIEDNIGIAFTYSEPMVWYEFVYDTCSISEGEGLKNVIITNGMINPEPLKKLIPLTHAWNVDLKGFTDDFYQKMCCGNLSSVLRTIKTLAESSVHLEITNLLIPGENDDIGIFRKMVEWIADIDRSIPLHISGYYPANQCRNPSTHISEINKFTGIAREYLEYVYAGNTGEPCTTYCPECETRLTLRQHYYINNSTINGKCPECGHSIYVED